MTTARKIGVAVLAVVTAGLGFLGWSVFDTWRKIPEAYAAWDVGTMLVCYMERNDNRWPTDWADLASSIKPDDECVFCRGVEDGNDRLDGYPKTIAKLKTMVRIDWSYVPKPGVMAYPVTTIHGKKFSVTWEGAEPNIMVYNWVTKKWKDPSRPI